ESLPDVTGDLLALARQLAVEPVGGLAVGVADVVHPDHHLEADPLLALDRPVGDADLEGVSPRLAAGRAAAHLLPVAVEVPAPEVARLHLRDPTRRARGTLSRAAHRPRGGRIEPPDRRAVVMDRRVLLVEFHVEAEVEVVVAEAALIV